MSKLFDKDGNEVEAFLPDEVQVQVNAATEGVKAEYAPKLTALETELGTTKQALNERSGEFAQFRKLNDDVVAKLSVAERTIYENGLALHEANEKTATLEKEKVENTIKSVIKSKAGDNEPLAKKMTDMWSLFGIEATTPEAMEQKAVMILGAIGTQEPDLVATVAGFNGGHLPPKPIAQKEGETFADTEAGKKGAADLGLILETPQQK